MKIVIQNQCMHYSVASTATMVDEPTPLAMEIDLQPLSEASPEPQQFYESTPELQLRQCSQPEPKKQYSPTQPDSAEINVHEAVVEEMNRLGYSWNLSEMNPSSFSACTTLLQVTVPPSSSHPTVRSSPTKSWTTNYSVLCFVMNGQLYAEYNCISNMLGLPPCSECQRRRIIQWTEENVTRLAEWSCEQVREKIHRRGDSKSWTTSYDGFYQTRGHYSNNSFATLHDYHSGEIAWFAHRTERAWTQLGGYVEWSRR